MKQKTQILIFTAVFLSLILFSCSPSKPNAKTNTKPDSSQAAIASSPATASLAMAAMPSSTKSDTSVQAASQNVPEGALKDCQFVEAKNFTTQYCSDCHTTTGASKHKAKALQNITMDTYHDWIQAAKAVPGVLDKAHLESKLMPPAKYPHQPTDAERQAIIDWVLRGSPNTESGQ